MTCRILVMDHHAAFRAITLQLLRKRGGHDVTAVGTKHIGDKALREAQRFAPDVILVDLSGPGLTGLAHIVCLRRALPRVKIIGTTLLEVETYRDVALAAGADELISKATFSRDLMPAVWHQPTQGDGATLNR